MLEALKQDGSALFCVDEALKDDRSLVLQAETPLFTSVSSSEAFVSSHFQQRFEHGASDFRRRSRGNRVEIL